jgi:hypothetical protein
MDQHNSSEVLHRTCNAKLMKDSPVGARLADDSSDDAFDNPSSTLVPAQSTLRSYPCAPWLLRELADSVIVLTASVSTKTTRA